MNRSDLEAAVRAHLAALGTSAGEVADRLHSQSIRGLAKNANCCPVARSILHAFSTAPLVSVSGECCTLYEPDRVLAGPVMMPKPVRDFVLAFDMGQHPGLLEKSA